MEKLTVIKTYAKIYLPVLILSVLFLATPLLTFYANDTWVDYLILGIKLALGFSIVIWLLSRFLIDLYQFHKRLLIQQLKQEKTISYKWVFKKENILTYLRSIIYITPFLLFTIYNILRVSKADTMVLEEYNAFLSKFKTWVPDYIYNFRFIYGQPIYLILATIATGCLFSLILLSLTSVLYRIALFRFSKQVQNRIATISEKLELENYLEEITGINYECAREDNELYIKISSSERNNIIELTIQLINSYFLKDTKKATTPPNLILTG